MSFLVFYICASAVYSQPPTQEILATNTATGVGEAVSGDSIKIDGKLYRLEYVIAPKIDQECLDKEIGRYFCGEVSRNFLGDTISNRIITCEMKRWSDNGEILSNCTLDDNTNLSNLVILSGWGIVKWFDRNTLKEPIPCSVNDCQEIPDTLFSIESEAVKNKRGLWSSKFDLPWSY